MTPLMIFNSTVLVLWMTMIIPDAIKNENKKLLWISSGIMLVAEIVMCLIWAQREFPFNLLAAFAIFVMALMGGRVMHFFYQKLNKEES